MPLMPVVGSRGDPADIRWDLARPGFLLPLLGFLGKVATVAGAVGATASIVSSAGQQVSNVLPASRALPPGPLPAQAYFPSSGGQLEAPRPRPLWQSAVDVLLPGQQFRTSGGQTAGGRPRRLQAVYTMARRRVAQWPMRVWPRRMNVLNARALSRAGRRVRGFTRRARRMERVLPHRRSSRRTGGRRRK